MGINRNKAILQYQKEAKFFNQEQYNDVDNHIKPSEHIDIHKDTKDVNNSALSIGNALKQAENNATPTILDLQDDAQPQRRIQKTSSTTCPNVHLVYETVMLIQLKRMIKRNTKAFAVMLKILIQGDPKRKN